MKPQSINTSNISHGTVTVVEQNLNNSNLDFNLVRDIAPSVPTTLAIIDNSYCNTMQAPVQSHYSSTVSGNASYPI